MAAVDSTFVSGVCTGVASAAAAFGLYKALSAAFAEQEALSTTSNNHDGNVYETDKAVAEYLQFHYGSHDDVMPYPNGPMAALDFPARTAEICVEWAQKAGLAPEAVLDVGCAVGRTSFDLSRTFAKVHGIDFSHAFVRAANHMKRQGKAKYSATIQSDLHAEYECVVPANINADRITFEQGDACNLSTDLPQFSVIHGANLLCRLPEPMAFLERLPSLLVPGGIVVLISPHSWLKQYTSKDKWLGGYSTPDGTSKRGEDGLKEAMEALNFKLLHQEDTPFVIREHIRKFQWGISHCTVWQLQ